MVTTSPDNLWSPDSSDDVDIVIDLAAMQSSTQSAVSALRDETPDAATQPEVNAGTVDDKFVTPQTLRNREGRPGEPFAMAAGIHSGGSGFVTVNFPSGRFTQIPIVTAQVRSGAGAHVGTTILVTTLTTSSFRFATSIASVPIMWQAVQMTAGNAEG